MPNHIDRYTKGSGRRRKGGGSWIDNTRAGRASIQKSKRQAVQFAEEDVSLNDRFGDSMNAEIARTVSPNDDSKTIEQKVGSVLERGANEKLDTESVANEIQRLLNEQNAEAVRLGQMEEETAKMLGRKRLFSPHLRLPAATSARGGLVAGAVGVSLLEVVLLHRPLATHVFARFAGWMANPPWSVIGTAIAVAIINGLTWTVANLATQRSERKRLAVRTNTEPPPPSSLLMVQMGVLAVGALQVLMVLVRFAGDNTGNRNPVMTTLSIVAILGVIIVSILEASLAGSPQMWVEGVLDRYRTLHVKVFDEIPRAIFMNATELYEMKVSFFRSVANVLAPEWATAAQSYINGMSVPEPPKYKFSWPDSIDPPPVPEKASETASQASPFVRKARSDDAA